MNDHSKKNTKPAMCKLLNLHYLIQNSRAQTRSKYHVQLQTEDL
uniref:60S acidic ribosomal protein P2 n=1 Tax=Rhizophora mucronata TaxID=61149 RepID=A0A2P2JPD1_RHIMU